MAIYNNETDPNIKQWEEQQHREMLLTSPSYREWWERNKPKPNEEQQNSDEEISGAE